MWPGVDLRRFKEWKLAQTEALKKGLRLDGRGAARVVVHGSRLDTSHGSPARPAHAAASHAPPSTAFPPAVALPSGAAGVGSELPLFISFGVFSAPFQLTE